jgi:NADH:ubiquinone oxidoreductase subunit K
MEAATVLSGVQTQLASHMVVAGLLMAIGLLGVLTSRHVIRLLMCLELMLNAANINLVAINQAVAPGDLSGQVMAIFTLTISAAEAAVGLAIVIALYRSLRTVDSDRFSVLKG